MGRTLHPCRDRARPDAACAIPGARPHDRGRGQHPGRRADLAYDRADAAQGRLRRAASGHRAMARHCRYGRMGGGGGSTVTAGGLLLRGEPDGNFVALDAKTGETLWKFQTGFGADAPAMVYEIDGDQYVAIVTGGNSIQGSAYGDAVWAFSLKGQLGPLWPPPPPMTIAGPGGAVAEGV